MADFANVIGGPAKINLAGTDLGHSQGGISASITPENREVTVDQFGTTACNIRHVGDSVGVTAPFAEWTAATLAEVYAAGNDQTAAGSAPYIGLGRSAGFLYPAQALKVIPLLTADVDRFLHIFRAVTTGGIELGWNHESDTIIEVEFSALCDATQSDGEYLGKLQVSA